MSAAELVASPTLPAGRKLSPSEVRRASEERQARAEKARQAMVEEKLARLAQANQSRQTVKSMMVGAVLQQERTS
jgi:hypothetical protein